MWVLKDLSVHREQNKNSNLKTCMTDSEQDAQTVKKSLPVIIYGKHYIGTKAPSQMDSCVQFHNDMFNALSGTSVKGYI